MISRKVISIISYTTILVWVISFVVYHNEGKSTVAQYDLKQLFGLGVLGALFIVLFIAIDPAVSSTLKLFTIMKLGIFIFLILGIVNTLSQKRAYFVNWFNIRSSI